MPNVVKFSQVAPGAKFQVTGVLKHPKKLRRSEIYEKSPGNAFAREKRIDGQVVETCTTKYAAIDTKDGHLIFLPDAEDFSVLVLTEDSF